MNETELVKKINDLSWNLACTMDFAKSLTSKGSYQYGNLETLEYSLNNKIKNIRKEIENVSV